MGIKYKVCLHNCREKGSVFNGKWTIKLLYMFVATIAILHIGNSCLTILKTVHVLEPRASNMTEVFEK
jgi:hypothetical protein